ncbi:MAG: MipA/OmpV family protein [Panacagrimonas sp.]
MPKTTRRLIFCAAALLVLTGAAAPKPEPTRLDLGAGVASLTRPDYRGSGEVGTLVLPTPYLAYHSERLQLSRDGLVARLFQTEKLHLGLSASASLPGDDSQDSVRRGMPELLPTFEIGPSLDWRLGEAGGTWDLRLPVRAVAAADFKEAEGIGWLAYPHLRFRRDWTQGGWKVETGAGAGPLWASSKYHRYFYAVEERFATLERPAYDVGGGYSGARATAYLGLRRHKWRIGLGITHDALGGSVMRDSPLVETDSSTVVAIGVFYTFKSWEWELPQSKP